MSVRFVPKADTLQDMLRPRVTNFYITFFARSALAVGQRLSVNYRSETSECFYDSRMLTK